MAWAMEQLVHSRPDYAGSFAPNWLPLIAAGLAAAGIALPGGSPRRLRVSRALLWSGLLLMVWAANGLPFDLLRVAGLIPLPVDRWGLIIRTLALAAAIALARLLLAHPSASARAHGTNWYGYAAFLLALPYPLLRTCWVLGGTVGLSRPGAGGEGFAPWLLSVPWLMAAVLSLFLVRPPHWMPRRLLLTAGWSATAIVVVIGPAASWSLVSAALAGRDLVVDGIATWVFVLFYSSWFLFAIAEGAATRSYQLRSAELMTAAPRLATARPSAPRG
jgi:hypothetical protein